MIHNRADLYARIKTIGGIADLSARAKFRLTGSDRVRYLNGQLTSDVRKLNAGESQYACVTTAKGKLCGDLFITAYPDSLFVDAEPSLRESLQARLERYIIADDAILDDVTGEYAILHQMLPPGGHSSGVEGVARNRFASQVSDYEGVDFIVPSSQKEELWRLFAETFPVIDAEMQEALRIEAGIPRWGFELNEDTLPPEAGLDRTAIDYHKGCYIGQEVISRLKSVGHVNRTLRGFILDLPSEGDHAAFAGADLLDNGKPAGRLTSTAYSFGLDTPVALGYLKRGIDGPRLTARAANGRTCNAEVKELPLIV